MKSYRLRFVEVVVALVIITLAACLILPWIQTTRVPQHRTLSLNNLSQILRATHSWASNSDDANPLPHGDFTRTTSSGHTLSGPYAAILPQLELQQIFDSGSPDAIIKTFISPHDSTGKPEGHASYAWNGGWVLNEKGKSKLTPNDGASNTILLSERVITCGDSVNHWSGSHPGGDLVADKSPYIPGIVQKDANTYATNAAPPAWATNTPVKNVANCVKTTPSGCHFGVILVAMGDGSTRNVSKTAGETNWRAAITPKSGDDFDSNW